MATIKLVRVLLTVFLLLGMCRVSAGQAVYGNIIGTVSDPSGGVVPNAAVIIEDTDRGITFQTTTKASGNYEQTHLLAGHYKIKITAAGFGPFEATADVQIDASTRVDARLGIQGSSTSVEVTSETPLLKVDRADVSTTLSTGELSSLPILNRNLTQMLLVTPGTQLNDWQHASSENPQGGYQVDVNGQQFTSNGFLLDGTENNSAILGIAVINPNLDSLQEFKVTTSNYDASFGSVAGALLQATTKSGTNSYHGSAFEYLRNDAFNAANWAAQQDLPMRWNQFGGSFGGPILKNKLFFFSDYQGLRRRRSESTITTVPTQAERNGDLRGLLGDYICAGGTTSPTPCANPAPAATTTEGTSVPARNGMIFDPTTGNPDGTGRKAISSGGQVNVLPSVPAAVTNILQFLPMPNTGGGAIANNYLATGGERFDSDQGDGRIDYNFSDVLHFFGRYTIADFSKFAPGAFGTIAGGPALNLINFAGTSLARNQSIALGATYTLSPTLITDFRFGFYRYRIRVQPNGVGTTPAADAGFPGLNLGTPETSGMPAFYVNGSGGFDFGYALGVNQCNCPLKETENHFQWVNNWTMTRADHTFSWGADIRRAQQQRVPSDSHRSGEISFNNSVTGSADIDNEGGSSGAALASFLLAQPSGFARYFTGLGFYPGLRQTRLFFYGQDSWRVTRKLTVNLGLRYENYLPQTAAKPGGAGSFDPSTGEVLVAGVGSVPLNMGVQAYNLGFAPRIGIAYQLQERTVVRAGYGRSFSPAGLGAVFGQAPDYDPPITIPQQVPQANNYTPVFNLLGGPPSPPNPTIGSNGRYPLPNTLNVFYFFDPPSSYRIPLADSWNLAVQHSFTSSLTAEVAYVGNVGRHLFMNPNVNQAALDPNCVADGTCNNFNARRRFDKFGLDQGLYQTCNCDNSDYHALQAKVQQRLARGLDFLVSYTWSKAMADTETGGAFSNNLNWKQDRGPANFDRAQALTISHLWELPYGRRRQWGSDSSRVIDLLLGGWNFTGITTVESGLPFTVTVSNPPFVYADLNSVRPDPAGDPFSGTCPGTSASTHSTLCWFNPAAFTEPQGVGRNGLVSHNSLRGPRFVEFDLGLGKTFMIAEGKTVEFKWENFNAFNHVNLANPNSTVDVSGAGQITSAADMREMQFGLHFRF